MFDPTIFENIKVVLEGAVYELDLGEVITITDRTNIIDLAQMNRAYGLTFTKEHGTTEASILVKASTDILAAEILEEELTGLGCDLQITFHVQVRWPETECEAILFLINKHWRSYHPVVKQSLSQTYGEHNNHYQNNVILTFKNGVDETDIDDIPAILSAMVNTLESLESGITEV